MRKLSATELLGVWDRGLTQQPFQQALILLAAACPDVPADSLARLSIGQRDAKLLVLRKWTVGPQLVSLTECPHCGENLELTFNTNDILMQQSSSDPVQGEKEMDKNRDEVLSLHKAGYEVSFKVPDSLDLAFVSENNKLPDQQRMLLQRCILAVDCKGEEREFSDLPKEVMEAVRERIIEADSQADVQLDLACPVCKHGWKTAFDIVSFFWSEIDAWARRTLREVHILASAYGWSEADILHMSPWRRRFYLELIKG